MRTRETEEGRRERNFIREREEGKQHRIRSNNLIRIFSDFSALSKLESELERDQYPFKHHRVLFFFCMLITINYAYSQLAEELSFGKNQTLENA